MVHISLKQSKKLKPLFAVLTKQLKVLKLELGITW